MKFGPYAEPVDANVFAPTRIFNHLSIKVVERFNQ